VLIDARLAPSVALRAAIVASSIAGIAAALLSPRAPVASLLGVVALAVSWLYSMPPVRLLGTGYGELATSTVVVGLVPTIGLLSHGGLIVAGLWWSIAMLLPLHMAMMLAFEIPDLASDARAGKRVLAVRIGAKLTRRIIGMMLLAAALVGYIGWRNGVVPPAAAFAILPAGVLLAAIRTERYDLLTASAVATFVVAGAGLTIGWVVS
jgi:1,4-dihydroxy-2-naphthoate octaprenyltransferase